MNLLRASRANPKLSSWSYLFGEFNFNATPLAPPGTKIIAHKDKGIRGSWDLNGESGWYVGPAMEHYRCITGYFPRSRRTRICDTVTYFPHEIPFPKVTLEDHLKQATSNIIDILTNPPSTTVPSLQAGDTTKNALLQIAQLLNRAEDIPTSDKAIDISSPRVVQAPQEPQSPQVVQAPPKLQTSTVVQAPPPKL